MPTDSEKAKNLFNAANSAALGICALGDVLKHTDPEHLEAYTLNHLGELLQVVGGQLLQTTYDGARHCQAPPAP